MATAPFVDLGDMHYYIRAATKLVRERRTLGRSDSKERALCIRNLPICDTTLQPRRRKCERREGSRSFQKELLRNFWRDEQFKVSSSAWRWHSSWIMQLDSNPPKKALQESSLCGSSHSYSLTRSPSSYHNGAYEHGG